MMQTIDRGMERAQLDSAEWTKENTLARFLAFKQFASASSKLIDLQLRALELLAAANVLIGIAVGIGVVRAATKTGQ